MFRRIIYLPAIVFIAFFFIGSCTKIDTTTIGSDIIPEVDNINTFADTLDVITTQGVFDGLYKDSTVLSILESHVIGKVTDPLMGSTNATIFLQLKPSFYPYYIGTQAKDTVVQADSVVLCLSYKTAWGDSSQPLQLQVYEVSQSQHGTWDSVSTNTDINFNPALAGPLSSVKTIDVSALPNFVKVGIADSVNNQIRIKLSDAFRDQLFSRDTLTNNSFRNDTLFRLFNNGFAVVTNAGNSLLYINLIEDKTRLELHYKKKNGGAVDTVYSNFYFNAGLQGENVRRSSTANNIVRNRNPLPSGDQELYLQTSPGTFANLYFPGLDTLSNRVIHRAEIQIQQIPDPVNDAIYTESSYLYLDLVDSGLNKWKPIYFDLNPSANYDPDFITPGLPFFPAGGEVNINYFGGYLRKRTDVYGEAAYYNINVSRYVQQIVTKRTPNYKMRLFPAHSFSYPQYGNVIIPYLNNIAYGRVRVGGGNNPNPQYKMRLRIVYSKIK